jgi:hypothetical protein
MFIVEKKVLIARKKVTKKYRIVGWLIYKNGSYFHFKPFYNSKSLFLKTTKSIKNKFSFKQ